MENGSHFSGPWTILGLHWLGLFEDVYTFDVFFYTCLYLVPLRRVALHLRKSTIAIYDIKEGSKLNRTIKLCLCSN